MSKKDDPFLSHAILIPIAVVIGIFGTIALCFYMVSGLSENWQGDYASSGSSSEGGFVAVGYDGMGEMQKHGCLACHKENTKLVGPSLREIAKKYKGQNALAELSKKVKDGGSGAWGTIPMPPNNLPDDTINSMVGYILNLEGDGGSTQSTQTTTKHVATAAEINFGNDLFLGKARLANKGPSCLSCHSVRDESVIGGGILAKELTTSYGTFGEAGLKAFINAPSNQIMKKAYEGRPVTQKETTALIAFLEQVNKDENTYLPPDVGIRLFVAGVVGTLVLFFIYSLLWRNRRKCSVNQDIYDRQIRSI